MSTPLRVLLIEDSEDDAALLLRELRRGGYEPAWERVDTATALTAALQRQQWDLITCDYVMPQFSAAAALALIREWGRDVPTIIVSGEVGEEVAVGAMKAGAHDFVSKHKLTRLVPAIERELREASERQARQRAEDALRRGEQHFRSLSENALDLVSILAPDGTARYVSPSHARVLGYQPEELLGQNVFGFVHPDDVPALATAFQDGLQTYQATGTAECRFRHKDGSWRILEGIAKNLLDDPVIAGVVLNTRDITERKRTEEALRESQARVRALSRPRIVSSRSMRRAASPR